MVFNPNERGNLSAAGQKDLSGVTSTIKKLNRLVEMATYFKMSASAWTTPRPFEGNFELGATISFPIETKVQVHPYQINQTLDIDVPEFKRKTLTFNRAYYFNEKLDKTQLNNGDVRNFIQNLVTSAGNSFAEAMDPVVIRTAMNSILPHLRGSNAGADQNINLGTTSAPLMLDGSSIVRFVVEAALALQNTPEGSVFESGNMFMLMPSMSQIAWTQSAFAELCCASGRTSILTSGAQIPNVAGFDIMYYDVPVKTKGASGDMIYPILFGTKDAVAFHKGIEDQEFNVMSERSFGRFFRGLMVQGAGVIHEKKLGLALATFKSL